MAGITFIREDEFTWVSTNTPTDVVYIEDGGDSFFWATDTKNEHGEFITQGDEKEFLTFEDCKRDAEMHIQHTQTFGA